MNRRRLLRAAAAASPLLPGLSPWTPAPARAAEAPRPVSRVRPADPAWPPEAAWDRLGRDVGGRLVRVESPLAACLEAPRPPLRRGPQGAEEPLLPRRRGRADPVARLGRRLDVRAERLRRRRRDHRGRGRGGRLRPRERPAARGEGRRPQLPGHLQRPGLAAGLDAPDGRDHPARRVRPRRLRRTARAAAGGHGRGRRDLGAGLRRRHDEGGPLRPGRRLPDRGRRRAGPGRRLRQLLEGVRHGRGEPAGGRGRHRRRDGADRQRLHPPGPVLGAQGRRRRQPRRRDPAHAAHARPAGVVRRGVRDRPGDLGRRVPPADRPHRRLLRREPAEPALGRADRLPAGQRARDRDGVPGAGPAAGGGGLAPVPRLAGRLAGGLRRRVRADDPGRAGPALLGPRVPQGRCPAWCSPTTARAPRKRTCSGRATRRRRGRSCTATGPRGCPPRSWRRTGGRTSPTPCSRRPGTGA